MSHRAESFALLMIGLSLAGVTATAAKEAVPLTGSYRTTLSAADLIRAGAPSVESADETGTWTLTFAKRSWTLRQEHAPDQNALDRGVIVVVGNRVDFTLLTSDGAPHRIFLGTFRWTVRSGTLRFSLLADQFSTNAVTVLTAQPWKRIR
jgi:hypothetical protein